MSTPPDYNKVGRDHFKLKCEWYTAMRNALYFYGWGMYEHAMERQFVAYAIRDEIEAATPPKYSKDWLFSNYLYRLGECE